MEISAKTKKTLIAFVVTRGQRVPHRYGYFFSATCSRPEHLPLYIHYQPPLAVSVSKAYSKSAVKRNRLRRKLIAETSFLIPELLKDQRFLVVIIKKQGEENEIIEHMHATLRKAVY